MWERQWEREKAGAAVRGTARRARSTVRRRPAMAAPFSRGAGARAGAGLLCSMAKVREGIGRRGMGGRARGARAPRRRSAACAIGGAPAAPPPHPWRAIAGPGGARRRAAGPLGSGQPLPGRALSLWFQEAKGGRALEEKVQLQGSVERARGKGRGAAHAGRVPLRGRRLGVGGAHVLLGGSRCPAGAPGRPLFSERSYRESAWAIPSFSMYT
ncbi:MAG: hypothetical protein J3K34DRAFT_57256 [Monoraphidium minutum]|nr:MAG: hypothetical protein J3K34DRAFT_57256 [Monoraphidium minutum]